jgi:hypothetical protein
LDDELAGVEHVDGIDGIEPLVIHGPRRPVDPHARQEIEPELS